MSKRRPRVNSGRTHQGRVALVTGAAQGLGQAIALALAERGARVIATDLAAPDETVPRIGPPGHALRPPARQRFTSAARSAGLLARADRRRPVDSPPGRGVEGASRVAGVGQEEGAA